MLHTVQEATARLGITRAALYAAMADGRLKYVEKYGKRLIDERALKAIRVAAASSKKIQSKGTDRL